MEYRASIILGDKFEDERGILTFINEFKMEQVKRMYLIEHPNVAIVRAWQGHKKEQKWFYVIQGGFELVLVQPDNWETPSASLPVEEFKLYKADNQVLHVPGGYANGIRALVPNSTILVFSDVDLGMAGEDNFRFDKHLWFDWTATNK